MPNGVSRPSNGGGVGSPTASRKTGGGLGQLGANVLPTKGKMVDIQNSKITDRLLEETQAQPYLDLPKKIADSIQPVLVANPINRVFILDLLVSDATSGTMITVSATNDTYILAAQISTTRSVLALSTRTFITCTPFGQPSKAIIGLMYEPVTAGSSEISQNYNKPIKLARGSSVFVTHSSATASIDTIGMVVFEEIEVV